MKVAIIDMGTNTFHLLVVEIGERQFKLIMRERIQVRMGAGGINQGIITEAGINRAVDAMKNFKMALDQLSIPKISAFGTSALRNAKNSAEVITRIKDATGIETRIISGDEEATLIYKGIALAMNLGKEKSLIIDIGGGSVEFIIGNDEQIFWKQSIEIGAQRLLERFQKHDPILPSEVEEVNQYFEENLGSLFDAIHHYKPRTLVGSSGTFDTLSDIYCLQSGIALNESPETPLTVAAFEEIYLEIISKDRAGRMLIPGMIEMRVDMIVVACCLIKFITDRFSVEQIRVSSYSLKEGVLSTLLKA